MIENDPTASGPSLGSTRAPTFAPERSCCDFESFAYYEDRNVYRALFSQDDESASTAVVSAVAAAADTDPLDIDPLHSTVDPDALDALSRPRRPAQDGLHVDFEFYGYEVTVSSAGCIELRPLDVHDTAAASVDEQY